MTTAYIWRIEWGDTSENAWSLLDFAFDEDDARYLVGIQAQIINATGHSPNGERGCAAVPIPRKDGPPRAYRIKGLDLPSWLRARRVVDPEGGRE